MLKACKLIPYATISEHRIKSMPTAKLTSNYGCFFKHKMLIIVVQYQLTQRPRNFRRLLKFNNDTTFLI